LIYGDKMNNHTYKLRIKDLPTTERPRERLIKFGPKALSDAELLAIILRTGNKKENVIDLCRRLLNNYNLKLLLQISLNELKKIEGIKEAKACQLVALFELSRRIMSFNNAKNIKIENPRDAAKLLIPEMSELKQEYFKGLYLDSRNNLIKNETIFIGSLNSSIVHPREIFKIALKESASAIILAHNHPSGDPEPTEEDIQITKKIIKVGKIIGIRVLDHIIIGNKNYVRFSERNLIDDEDGTI